MAPADLIEAYKKTNQNLKKLQTEKQKLKQKILAEMGTLLLQFWDENSSQISPEGQQKIQEKITQLKAIFPGKKSKKN